MFLLATAFNVNGGVAMLPLQVLFLNFVIAIIPVIIITTDPPDPDVMTAGRRATRAARIFDRTTVIRWIGARPRCSAGPRARARRLRPGRAVVRRASTPVTMGFVVIGLGTAFAGLTMHRSRSRRSGAHRCCAAGADASPAS